MTTDPQPNAAPPANAVNPFAGIPVADFVRDGAALLLLLLSLAMPWQYGKDATDLIAVVLLTLLSVLSLGLTYLGRAKVFGPGVTGPQVALMRAAANVPYVILVIVYIVMDVAKDDTRGIGFAAAIGLTGAALAGMPRSFETDASPLGNLQRVIMRAVAIGLGALWTVFTLLNLIFTITDYTDGMKGFLTVALVLRVLVMLAGFGLLAFGLLKASEVGRQVAVVVGLITLGTAFIDWFTDWDLSGGIESVRIPGFAVMGLLTIGVVASSHIVKSLTGAIDAATKWVNTAVIVLAVGAALALVAVVTTILLLLADIGYPGGKSAAFIVVNLLIAVVSAAAAFLARTAYAKQKLLVIVAAGLLLILGIVATVINNSIASAGFLDIAHAFGVPIAVLIVLLAPASVRAAYGGIPLPAAQAAPAPAGQPAPPAPTSAPAAQPAPPAPTAAPAAAAPPPPPAAPAAPAAPAHPRAAEAADPNTSAAALYDIATTIPELRATVAANPSAYPDLLDWLGKLGDPEVNAAIAARS